MHPILFRLTLEHGLDHRSIACPRVPVVGERVELHDAPPAVVEGVCWQADETGAVLRPIVQLRPLEPSHV